MKLGNANIQSVDYLYTVQGWLDKINNNQLNYTTDKFAMDLDYLLNGNISTQKWGQPEESITHPVQYEYTYDVANRLTEADYTNSNTSATDDDNNGYDVSYSYDKNGTMLNAIRKSAGYYAYPSNSLTSTTIESTSNRLTSYGVTSGPTSPVNYTVLYDANGNMTQNRFTSASYNERNLMTQVTKGGATVKFGYDADGNRIRKEMVSGVETHYVRGADGQTIAVYEDGALEFVNL